MNTRRYIAQGCVCRRKTTDEDIVREVIQNNLYDLPSALPSETCFIDIGAHIGTATVAARNRGAKLVIAVEAEPSNFKMLTVNAGLSDKTRVICKNVAIWREDSPENELRLYGTGSHESWSALNRAGAAYPHAFTQSSVYTLKKIIEETQRVLSYKQLWVKVSCEGAEFPILMTSSALEKIDRLFIRYRLVEDVPVFAQVCRSGYYFSDLIDTLKYQGFAYRCTSPRNDHGVLWASRS